MGYAAGSLTVGGIAAAFVATLVNQDSTGLYIVCAVVAAAGHDTKMALTEARREGMVPFALTVDRAGHDYLKQMCQDMAYEVVADIESLPRRLPTLYRRLTG